MDLERRHIIKNNNSNLTGHILITVIQTFWSQLLTTKETL